MLLGPGVRLEEHLVRSQRPRPDRSALYCGAAKDKSRACELSQAQSPWYGDRNLKGMSRHEVELLQDVGLERQASVRGLSTFA